MLLKNLQGATVTITGGTGSFGSKMAQHLLSKNISEIRIFSRDEAKQDLMRSRMADSRVKFYIGDTRDFDSVNGCIKGSDLVFHAAALKQVPSAEFFPMEAVKTNVLGSQNVIQSSVSNSVLSVVCLSTDKAVYPINAMGVSKAMMEKVAVASARSNEKSKTRISVTRYGNVMFSRGSVLPLFVEQAKASGALTITSKGMTRFMMSLDDSVALVEHAFMSGNTGDIFVKKSPGANMVDVAHAVGLLVNGVKPQLVELGVRHGEKMYETLMASEEAARAEDQGDFFRIPMDARGLNYSLYFKGDSGSSTLAESYTSETTQQLSVEDLRNLIRNLPEYVAAK